jgi:hypothetical protein
MARSRRPTTLETSMPTNSAVASSENSTGVTPLLTEWRGPRTECAGFDGITWPVTSQSNNMRIQARCCLTEGGDISRARCSMYAATCTGCTSGSRVIPRPSHQRRNTAAARAYAARVFRLRILTVKNSTKRSAARSPAPPINAGNPPAVFLLTLSSPIRCHFSG